jgi:hypothetical protein
MSSIEYIERLSMNSHFHGLLLQVFLSGYNKPCEIKIAFMALPILMYSESREKLASAKNTSKIETLFNTHDVLENDVKISGKVKLAGFLERYNQICLLSKKALIILYSEKKIVLNQNKIVIVEMKKYSNYKGNIRKWLKAAHYLGVIFAKTNEEYIHYFLGVDS